MRDASRGACFVRTNHRRCPTSLHTPATMLRSFRKVSPPPARARRGAGGGNAAHPAALTRPRRHALAPRRPLTAPAAATRRPSPRSLLCRPPSSWV
jgi:hypothetical protein